MDSKGSPQPLAWLNEQANKEARTDKLPFSERMGQLVGIAGFIVVVLFIAIHQTRPTGFFTDDDGSTAAAVIYIMFAFGIVPLLVRFCLGRKNAARPFELVSFVPFLVGQLYLLAAFPFDFAHFADPLPRSLEFLLDWVSPSFAKLILVIGIIGSAVFMVYNFLLYLAVRERLAKKDSAELKTSQ
jgi:peptidoglycan biosynthesis protein MviN/MurJ (putative lipid II flippase)